MNKPDTNPIKPDQQNGRHGGHGWMMMICCVPMLVIAIALVATGVASSGFIFAAVACTAMMFMMMRMMGGMGGNGGEQR
jgi:cytosine/uracil/thiamine/allantoin permease